MTKTKLFFLRVLIVVLGLFFLPYVFMAELVKETGRAFRYAWWEVKANIAEIKYLWKHGEKAP